jgi:hypothetical protein
MYRIHILLRKWTHPPCMNMLVKIVTANQNGSVCQEEGRRAK